MPTTRRLAAAALLTLICCGISRAVEVRYWTAETAQDNAGAYLEDAVVTSYGAVQLARQLTPLAADVEGASVVYDVAEAADGTVYAATGPTGVLLRIRGETVDRYELAGAGNALCLLAEADGTLLVGTGGGEGRVLRVSFDGDAARVDTLFEAGGVRYVWKLARHADGTLYAATGGDAAALYAIDADGGNRQVFAAAGETNLISLALTGGDDLYAGTDPSGLVWKIDRAGGTASVLFDAGEPEITALVLDGETLYAVGASRGEGTTEDGPVGEGRPAVFDERSPLDSDAVEPPQPPDLPPAEPDRVPLDGFQDAPELPELPDDPMPAIEMDGLDPPLPSVGLPAADFAGEGSAIYRIDLNTGLVSGVYRDSALLLDLVSRDGKLLAAAAGEDGRSRLLSFDPATQETAVTAEPELGQITKLAATADGRLLLGLSNPAGVSAAGRGYAQEGILESPPLDAGAVSSFGTMRLDGGVPAGTKIFVSVRAGNTADPEQNPGGWGEWTEAVEARRYLPASVQPARFFQYKLILRGDGTATPSVEGVRVAYQPPNLPPQVSDVEIASELTGLEPAAVADQALGEGAEPSSVRAVSWAAADPDGDPLTYEVFVRKGRRGEFQKVAGDVGPDGYAWDARATGDGVYEVRVVASDASGNPPGRGLTGSRVSRPFTVDLTPPVIGDVGGTRDGDSAEVALRVADAGGTVLRLEYCLGGDPADAASWIRAFPEDTMADSPQERYVLKLRGVAAGPQILRLRAADDSGNVVYQSVALAAAE